MSARRLVALGAVGLLLSACAERRDTADIAAGQAPFAELRGVPFTALRAGEVRAFRRDAVAAPNVGLAEVINGYSVNYAVPDFSGADGSWPPEDAMVMELAAMRPWPNDSSARAAFDSTVQSIRDATGTEPGCSFTPVDAAVSMVEFDREDGLFLSVRVVPAEVQPDSTLRPALTRLAIRRMSYCPQP